MVWQRVAGNAESCLGVRGPVEIGCLSLLAFMRETRPFSMQVLLGHFLWGVGGAFFCVWPQQLTS